jgi:hypothetical protein
MFETTCCISPKDFRYWFIQWRMFWVTSTVPRISFGPHNYRLWRIESWQTHFSGNSSSDKKLCILHDVDTGHCNVITNIKAAMCNKYIWNACDMLYDFKNKFETACFLCTATPPCNNSHSNYCDTCNRTSLAEKCSQIHLTLRVKSKLVCEWRQVCRNCSFLVTSDSKHEFYKKLCDYCNKKKSSGHF